MGEEVNVYRFACIHRFFLVLVGSPVLLELVCFCVTYCRWSQFSFSRIQVVAPLCSRKATRSNQVDFPQSCWPGQTWSLFVFISVAVIFPQWPHWPELFFLSVLFFFLFSLSVWKIQTSSCMKVLKEKPWTDLDVAVLTNVSCVQNALEASVYRSRTGWASWSNKYSLGLLTFSKEVCLGGLPILQVWKNTYKY